MEDIVIRKGRKEDLDTISIIVKKVWDIGGDYLMEKKYGLIGNKPWDEWISNDILTYLRENPENFLVAECQGKVVGFISYRLDTKRKVGTVGYNAVEPDYGGRSIGTRLLKRALKNLREKGMLYAKVITGLDEKYKPARGMYEKAGFEPLSESINYSMKL